MDRTPEDLIRVGDGYEKDLYILGRAPNGKLAGIVTSTAGV